MFRKLLAAICIMMIAVMLAPYVFAEDTAEFALSAHKTYLGEEVTATLTFKSDKNNIADIQGIINFNDKVLEFVDCDDVTYSGGGTLNFHAFTDTGAEGQYKMTFIFKTIGEGDGFIKLINCNITDSGQNGVRSPSAQTSIEVAGSAEVTTKKTETQAPVTESEQTTTTTTADDESSKEEETTTTTTTVQTKRAANGEVPEGKLKELKISTGYISPAFSYDVLEYEIKVPQDCVWLDIEGVPSLENGYIWYTGDENVYDGFITRTIAVRDSAGNETVYTFHISRMTEEDEENFSRQETVTSAPESEPETVTSTTRKLALEEQSGSFKKMIAAAGIVIVVILVVIIAIAGSKSSNKKRKKIKHSKKS